MKYDDTDIALRYGSARRMPEETLRLWLDAIAAPIGSSKIRVILDVGCGTGRFSAGLSDRFNAEVIGVDPSQLMLDKARGSVSHPRVAFRDGNAERLPVDDASICLVFMSMAYHHMDNPAAAASEFKRVLRSGGFLCIRNSTLDRLNTYPYLEYFPQALDINRKRLPSQSDVIDLMQAHGLPLVTHEVIEQQFAASLREYYDKIKERALSDLKALSDAEFQAGIQRMKKAVNDNESARPIMELIDLFIFQEIAEPSAPAD